jgi:hypothetical protein
MAIMPEMPTSHVNRTIDDMMQTVDPVSAEVAKRAVTGFTGAHAFVVIVRAAKPTWDQQSCTGETMLRSRSVNQ